MKLTLVQESTIEVEIDPDAFVNEFRQEADDYFESPARFADAKDLEEFIIESIHIMGIEDFLYDAPWIVGEAGEADTNLSVDVSKGAAS